MSAPSLPMILFSTAGNPLASISEYPSIGESIAFQLNGLIVVFIALGSIWGLLEVMGFVFRRQLKTQPAPVATAAASTSPTPAELTTAPAPASDDIPPEILAVIAAVVATVINQPHRIARVATESLSRDWAREGRREIFGSHKVR